MCAHMDIASHSRGNNRHTTTHTDTHAFPLNRQSGPGLHAEGTQIEVIYIFKGGFEVFWYFYHSQLLSHAHFEGGRKPEKTWLWEEDNGQVLPGRTTPQMTILRPLPPTPPLLSVTLACK